MAYSEKNVVKIKKEISEKQKELTDWLDRIEKAKDEFKRIESIKKDNQDFLASFFQNKTEDLTKKKEVIEDVFLKNSLIVERKKELETKLVLLLNAINNFEATNDNDTFLASLINEAEKMVRNLHLKITTDTEIQKQVSIKKENVITELTEKENKLLSQVNIAQNEIKNLNELVVKLSLEKQNLQSYIDKIKKREQTSKVMLFRLSERWLQHYKGLPFKKDLLE